MSHFVWLIVAGIIIVIVVAAIVLSKIASFLNWIEDRERSRD